MTREDVCDHFVGEGVLAFSRLLVYLPGFGGQRGALCRLQLQLASGLERFVEFFDCVNVLLGRDW